MSVKFSIVTPSRNSQDYIGETLESVLSQRGDFEIEYFIVDAESTDNTREIVRHYQYLIENNFYPVNCKQVNLYWISEQDNGMYDAINKGFGRASGDIYAWVNSDDIYLPGAFHTVASVFNKYISLEWVKGITSYINRDSIFYKAGRSGLYTQAWIKNGVYGRSAYFIQQTSVFWRSRLWDKISAIDPKLKVAGDYYLWRQFAEHTSLVAVDVQVSCFRRVPGQLSQDISRYHQEMAQICPPHPIEDFFIKQYFRRVVTNGTICRWIPDFIQALIYRLLFGNHQYSAVIFSADGEPRLLEGNYFEVARYL